MRSYGQYCGLAKALDLVGDRWTLLIVRELLIREGCRYTDLLNGLPGIATNLLAERLKELEKNGIVYREEAPPPIATTLFHLTNRGKELEEAVLAIGRWGGPLLAGSGKKDVVCSHWLVLPLKLYLRDREPESAPVRIEIHTGDEPLTIETVGDGMVRARPGLASKADGRLTGTPKTILAFLTGKMSQEAARKSGVEYEGDAGALRRIWSIGKRESGNSATRKSSH